MANTRKNRKNNASRKNRTMSGGKRKMSAYMKFANKHRKEMMASNPKMRVPDIGRALGKKWRALSESEKKSYA
jgi:hypothetical protein